MTITTKPLPLLSMISYLGFRTLLVFLLAVNTISLARANEPDFSEEEKRWIKANQQITAGFGKDWAPFNFVDNAGNGVGISHDYITLIENKSGLRITRVIDDWAVILENFKQGDIDILPSALVSKEREAFGTYLPPHLSLRDFIFVRDDNDSIHSLYDLQGKRIATIKGYATLEPYLVYLTDIDIIEVNNTMEMVSAVLNGKADAFFESQATISHFLRVNMLSGLRGITQTLSDPAQVGILIQQDADMLYAILNKTLQSITTSEHNTLNDRWLNIAITSDDGQQSLAYRELSFSGLVNATDVLILVLIVLFTISLLYLPFAKKRLFNLKLKHFVLLLFGFEIGMILMIVYQTIIFDRLENQLAQLNIEHAQMIQKTRLLHTSSDEQTHFARAYVATGNQQFKNSYTQVINIRQGLQQRPEQLDGIYWDLQKTVRQELYPLSEATSIVDLFATLPFTEFELNKLEAIEKDLNLLNKLEQQAFQSMENGYRQKAIEWLYSDNYFNAKHQVLLPLDGFLKNLDARVKHDILKLEERIARQIRNLAITCLLFIYGNIICLVLNRRKIIRPISYLTDTIQQFRSGIDDVQHRTFFDDEIGYMISSFFDLKFELDEHQNKLIELNKKTQDSIDYAALIQHSLLPESEKLNAFFDEYFVIWQPKDIVGGDIYLFEQISEHEGLLFIIDCTGHGVSGAFVSIMVRSIERQLMEAGLAYDATRPGELLSEFNISIKELLLQEGEDSVSNAGFDGGILYLNKNKRLARYAGSNTSLFIVEEDQFKVIKGNRQSVGYVKSSLDYHYQDHEYRYKDEFQFYLTTDGYLDQLGGSNNFPFGKKRFINLLAEHKDLTMADQREYLLMALVDYQQDNERQDDITVFGSKIKHHKK